jgi:hypothetical protein
MERQLVRFKIVFTSQMKNRHTLRRFFGAAMVLFVFSLPLHFHPVAASVQVAKECSCVQGTRTVASLAPAPADWIPVLAAQPVASESLDCPSNIRLQNHAIRAPPSHSL